MATSLFSRKRDLVYFVHFTISLPMMFIMDLQPLYPPDIIPEFMNDLKNYYINNYHDQYFVESPPFFTLFLWSEILFQAPIVMWGLGGLYQNSPKVPLALLPYSVVVFLTTLTCMVEYSYWPVPLSQKITLTTLYGPYLALSAFMLVDMFLRLNNLINRTSVKAGEKKLQ